MRVAVASQNFRTVTGHAGRTRRWLIYEVPEAGEPALVDRLDLPREMSFHEFHGDGPHPVDQAAVMIVAGCGAGFRDRMAGRGLAVHVTEREDPLAAIAEWRGGS